MNKPQKVDGENERLSQTVFVSYASADRKEALAVCKAIERRGVKCWISCRDVEPGENYQEAIVAAIEAAQAMVLVFSEAANNSNEIKKELSLASRFGVTVIALRIEDVEPSKAFAYELSTRQWIDAFDGWDRSINSLVRHIRQVSPAEQSPSSGAAARPTHRAVPKPRLPILAAAAAVLLLVLAAGAWWLFRPEPAAAHSMMVRLTGFSNLSSDLPSGMPDAMRDEIIAAFNDDGVVGVSTAPAPPPGTAPAYALGGTIRRDGDQIKVNIRLTDERSGATLWSNMFSYDADELGRVPRHIAVDAGNMLRCGLFGASTYSKTLSDPVLADYMQYCDNSGLIDHDPGKELLFAQKVVAAAPDFSWGWSGVADGAFDLAFDTPEGPAAAKYRQQASDAADKALSLDKTNSDALDIKGGLLDPRDFAGREKLFRAALAARPLACGCEHHLYGLFLQQVGRNSDAIAEYRAATDALALDADSQWAFGDALTIAGKPDEAKAHFDAANDLSDRPGTAAAIVIGEASVTQDYAAALKALGEPKLQLPATLEAALQTGFQAMISHDPAAKARAVQMLTALSPEMQGHNVVTLLAALGANQQVMQIIAEQTAHRAFAPLGWLYVPASRGVLNDPAFPAFAQRMGLMTYWRTTHTKPDVCSQNGPPPFCAMI